MTSIACVKWNDVSVSGFWFLTNFLRSEGMDEKMVMLVIANLTKQYETYRGESGKHFGPTFCAKTRETLGKQGLLGSITMQQPISLEVIGDIYLDLSNGLEDLSIIPF